MLGLHSTTKGFFVINGAWPETAFAALLDSDEKVLPNMASLLRHETLIRM